VFRKNFQTNKKRHAEFISASFSSYLNAIKKLMFTCLLLTLFPHTSEAFFGFGKTAKTHNALVEAAQLGNIHYVKSMIKRGVNINSFDENGHTALIKAASNGNDQMLTVLLAGGANINFADSEGNTALHFAAQNDHADAVKVLINKGAIINAKNKKGQTPMELAIKSGSVHAIMVIDPGALSVVQTESGFVVAAAGLAGGGVSTTTVVAAGAGVAAAGAGIAAAAGGGGGGSEGSSSGGGSPDNGGSGGDSGGGTSNNTDLSLFPSPNPFAGVNLVNASVAHNRGYTGEGVLVAVVDTGVDLNHEDLIGNVINGRNFFNNGAGEGGNGDEEGLPLIAGQSISGDFWHGTHVAGIIAGNNVGGSQYSVAYDANILPVNVYTFAQDTLYDIDIAKGIDYSVTRGARAINLSLGGDTPSPVIKTSIQNAVNVTGNNSIVVVAAAGNLYAGQAVSQADNTVYPARYAGDGTINQGNFGQFQDRGALLAVGAVDQNGQLASFSHKCGDAMNWCLVAPGDYYIQNGLGQRQSVGIFSTVPDDLYAFSRGTSMVAPYVSGAVAVLLDMDPQLTGREVAEILLLTATDKGATGVDAEYGHGLLNLDKATQPLGITSIPLSNNVNGASVSLDSSSISTSSVFGDALINSDLSFTILDSYKRAYDMNVADLSNSDASIIPFENRFRDFGENIADTREKIGENISFVAVNLKQTNPAGDEEEEFVRMSFSATSDNGGFDFNYNVPMNQAFRLSALDSVSSSTDNVGANSVLGLVPMGTSYNNYYAIDKKSSFSFGSFQGVQEYGDVMGVVSQYSRNLNSFDIAVQFGMMNEENSFLGSKTEGAFALSEQTPTWFYNFATGYNLSDSLKLFGSANYGISFPKAGAESLISGISKIETYSFSGGLSKKAIFDGRDKFEFIVSQPLRVVNGNADVVLPIGRDISGNITTGAYDLNLSPSGRQIDIGSFYSFATAKNAKLSAGGVYMIEPNHNKNAPDEMLFMAKYGLEF
jgi:subtilisin family serine protease